MSAFKDQHGFTLLEIILLIAVFAIMAGATIPIYQSFQVKNDLDIAAYATAQSLRRAQELSMNGIADAGWGAHVQTGAVIIFKGTSYVTRDLNYDEEFTLATSITPTGTVDYVFNELTGEPTAIGTLIMTSSNGNVKNISVNAKGVITY